MKNLKNSLKNAIKENLPEQVGKALRERLDELEIKEKELEEVSNDFSELEEKHEELKTKHKEIKTNFIELLEKKEIMEETEKKQEALEIAFIHRSEILEIKEKHAEEKCSLMKEMYSIPFANRKIRESTFSEVPFHHEDIEQTSEYNEKTGVYETKGHKVRRDEIMKTCSDTIKEEC